jgi:hypothetical protein
MKYARELMELMAAYPGREWKMAQLVRHCTAARVMTIKETRANRKAVLRALEALAVTGAVLVRPPSAARGGYAHYRWRD